MVGDCSLLVLLLGWAAVLWLGCVVVQGEDSAVKASQHSRLPLETRAPQTPDAGIPQKPRGPHPKVLGFCLEEGALASGSLIRATPGTTFRLRLYGTDLRNHSWPWVAFVPLGSSCAVPEGGLSSTPSPAGAPELLLHDILPVGEYAVLVTVKVASGGTQGQYHLCSLAGHQWAPAAPGDAILVMEDEGGGGRVAAVALPPPLAPWLLGTLVALLLAFLALLRVLQLSTLWLDPVELYVLRDCGSESEREASKVLETVRQRGTFVLCSLLLLSSLANAALAVLFYRAVGMLVPAILGVAGLVFLLAEVLPFTISSRWGLLLAPRGLWLTQLFMLLTFPISLPLSKVLELALHHDTSTCLLREKILDMVRNSDPYNEFVREEFSKGALRNKTVEDVLTPLDECFMLNASAVLDFNNMSMIMQSGYTRIPVYEEERTNLVDMLYVKDLAMVDPDDCTPLSTIIKFYNHPLHFVFNDTKLDAVLEEFKRGKSHMAIVQKVNNEGEGDPFYEVMGLVTLEDVIEEIIKSEIMDESDDYRDNKMKKKPPHLGTLVDRRKEDFSLFKVSDSEYKVKISPQLLLATQRFLSREVDLFSPARISEKVLLHLLKHPSVNQEVKFDESNRLAPEHYLYQRNQPVNYFILILQGRVEVEIGKEGLKFENGAFTYYGVSALTAPSSVHQSPVSTLRMNRRDQQLDGGESSNFSMYCPDYTVRALTDLQFIKVTRLQYLNALMASRIQNSPQSPDAIELKIVPSSQTKLLNDKNAATGKSRSKLNLLDEESLSRSTGV
ncbi:metal transporter CNNM3 isoform X2 [Sphaerodactylus townsendi]|uniref:metal transporter CNNM3 isoform X2 n=1 Tax=Sphaerodactylus townsendi TaxID=933632 RepID=UPI0020262ED9|nr:metal transporter CNNM3 isoform X2 [Sphaerodactylus townsendi]